MQKNLPKYLVASLCVLIAFFIPVYKAPLPDGVSVHPVKPKQIKAIADVLSPVIAEADPIVIETPKPAPSAPVASTGGCVSGYATGDYYLDKIISYESGGNSCATNYLGCFGLLQACPGEPLRAACGGSPACQIDWFQANKTGGRSWATVWQHELDFGWW